MFAIRIGVLPDNLADLDTVIRDSWHGNVHLPGGHRTN